MSREKQKRGAHHSFAELGREMGARTVMFHEAVASRLGLTVTEHKCLDLLLRAGQPLTAGQLAEHTGLTTGAITGLVDRLEKAGYVRRERSKTDRRQVLIHPLTPSNKEIMQVFQNLGREISKVNSRFSEKEQTVIQDFLSQMIEVFKEQTAKLRKEKPESSSSK